MAEVALKTFLEVLSMRAQYLRDITEQVVETARHNAHFVEQGHDAVFSVFYRTASEALTNKLEVEVAKILRTRIWCWKDYSSGLLR